jgi:hypothetical protein
VRETILNQDWETLSGMLDYPISMTADTQVENAEEFLAFLKGKKISTAFLDAVEQESCVDMFANYQGICISHPHALRCSPCRIRKGCRNHERCP